MFPGGGQDPFAAMFGMMNQMDQMMNQMFQGPAFGMPAQAQPPPAYQQYPQTVPRVEEVPYETAGRAAASGPIVEEPDDDGHHAGGPQHVPPQTRQHAHPQQPQQPRAGPAVPQDPFGMQLSPFGGVFGGMPFGNMMCGMGANGGMAPGQEYSYSSSTVMSSGPGGAYHSSTTSRQGPGGVRETQKTVRDGRTGMESMTIARGLGEQERVVTRTRDATGQVVTQEHHAGIQPSSAHEFDQQWVQRAQETMPPGWMQQHDSTQRIGPGGMQQQQQQPQLALPPAAAPQYGNPYEQQQQGHYRQGGGTGYTQQQQQGRGGGRGSGGVGGIGGGRPGGYHV